MATPNLDSMYLEFLQIPGDGHCFFSSLAVQLIGQHPYTYKDLRRVIADEYDIINENENKRKEFLDKNMDGRVIRNEIIQTLEDERKTIPSDDKSLLTIYANMIRTKLWAGIVEMYIFNKITKIPIRSFISSGKDVELFLLIDEYNIIRKNSVYDIYMPNNSINILQSDVHFDALVSRKPLLTDIQIRQMNQKKRLERKEKYNKFIEKLQEQKIDIAFTEEFVNKVPGDDFKGYLREIAKKQGRDEDFYIHLYYSIEGGNRRVNITRKTKK